MTHSAVRRSAHVATVSFLLIPMVMPVAWAETADGSRNSYISNWMVGKESASWSDPNLHDGRTSLTHKVKCSAAPDSGGVIPKTATYNLRQTRSLKPDVNFGDRTLSCTTTGTAYYGRMPAGTFKFRLAGLSGGDTSWLKLSVSDFRIRW